MKKKEDRTEKIFRSAKNRKESEPEKKATNSGSNMTNSGRASASKSGAGTAALFAGMKTRNSLRKLKKEYKV